MLDLIYLHLRDMGITASLVILAVLLLRLLLRKAPKVWSYALWGVVLVRLLCPWMPESPASVLPELEPTQEQYSLAGEDISFLGAADAAQQALGDALNGGLGLQHIPTQNVDAEGNRVYVTSTWWEVWILFGKYVWLAGALVLLIWSLRKHRTLRRQLRTAVRVSPGIWEAEGIPTAFVLGLFRPQIYLPVGLSGKEREYILLHEQCHIRRLDPLWKALGFAALCLHWWNPLVWAAFILAGRDMEMSCDEAVIQKLGPEIRRDYSTSLLRVATGKPIIAGSPLAFGEGDAGKRIRNLAKWKKPALWAGLIGGALCILAVILLLTDPLSPQTPLLGHNYPSVRGIFGLAFSGPPTPPEVYALSPGGTLFVRYTKSSDWEALGQTEEYPLTREEFLRYCPNLKSEHHIREITEARILKKANQTFYLIFQTRGGDIYFAEGWEDVSERNDPYSDDTNVYNLYLLERAEYAINVRETVPGLDVLRERYPEFFGLPTEKGLDVYVWQLAQGSYQCVLLPTQEEEPDEIALLDHRHVGLDTLRVILRAYDLPPEQIRVIPKRMIHSSYFYQIDESYTQRLRYLLGLSSQLPEWMSVDYNAQAVRVGLERGHGAGILGWDLRQLHGSFLFPFLPRQAY